MKTLASIALFFCLAAAPASKPADPLQLRARELVDSGALKQIEAEIDAQLPDILGNLKKIDGDRLIRLATLREMARRFGRINDLSPANKQALRWLIVQPNLAPALMLSMTEYDPPDRVLEILAALYADQHQKLEAFPDLTAAICLVWDAPDRFGPEEDAKLDPKRVIGLFRYFAARGTAQLPPELLAYSVDLALSEEEIAWVQERFARQADVPNAFSDVMFNEGAYFDRDPKKLLDTSFLMQNIQRMGGRCGDQAYYAAQVGKVFGIGTAVCNAMGYEDASPGAAWTGYLQPAGRGVAWNFFAARYPQHDAWPAEIIDPQTMNVVSPADAEILALLANVKPQQRQTSAALCKVRETGGGREFELLMKAIELSPGNRAAWFALADLCDGEKLPVQQSAQVIEKIKLVWLKDHADFALRLRLRMIAHRAHDVQLKELAAMAKSFPRADLFGRIKLREADLQIQDKQKDPAIAACGEAITASGVSSPIAYMAMLRVNRLLQDDQPNRLAEIYGKVFDQLVRPRPSAEAHTTPYDLIGRRYAELLDELKRGSDAINVRTKLDSLVTAGVRH